jgi:hypothetical protein
MVDIYAPMNDFAAPFCITYAYFNYGCSNGVLDIPIIHPKDVVHPSEAATAGSPAASFDRKAGALKFILMKPMKQPYPWLIQLVDFAFYNFHYKIHKQHVQSTPGQSCIWEPIHSAPGWLGHHLQAYVCSGGIGNQLLNWVVLYWVGEGLVLGTEHHETPLRIVH